MRNGDRPDYVAVHKWVKYHLGRPLGCERCGKTDPWASYEWSNISYQYLRDVSDWQRLCGPCHAIYDGLAGPRDGKQCRNGHLRTPENTYRYPGSERSECITCRKEHHQMLDEKRRLEKDQSLSAYEACYNCSGSGLQDGIDGPTTCYVCGGKVVVRARDQKGRFTTKPIKELAL